MYHCYGDAALYDTYVLSNATPQLKQFNNGPWKALEKLVREDYSIRFEEIWIFTGPIFDDSNGRLYLQKDEANSSLPQNAVEIPGDSC